MKYAIWFVRLIFAAWMIPAGLNHFIPLFPQPMGNQPLSTELITALLDSHMFDMTKAVELLAGLAVLTGFYAPLMVIVCMPVSFCVWYWDVPLQGWSSGSAIYGWAVLVCNLVLCLSYVDSYRAMLAPRADAGRGARAGGEFRHGLRDTAGPGFAIAVRHRAGPAARRRRVLLYLGVRRHRPLRPAHPRLSGGRARRAVAARHGTRAGRTRTGLNRSGRRGVKRGRKPL